MKVLVDNVHGYEITGKRSHDGRLLELAYSREIARGQFTTNKSDVDFLLSYIGKKIIVKMHEDAVIEYIKQLN